MLVLTALTLVTVDFRSGGAQGDGPLAGLRRVASTVLGPIQDGLATLVSPIGDAMGGVTDLFDVRAENAQLRSRLEQLQERRRSYDDLLRENEEYAALLELQERTEHETVAAQVINWGPSNFEWTITLDVGTNAGVQRNMPVINGDGLVGRVITTTADTSRVLLAIDPTFQAKAWPGESAEAGTLQGDGGEPMVFRPLQPEAEIAVGDEIVTSSYDNGVFPPGIPIGTVVSAEAAAGLLERNIRVRPFVDFSSLTTVLVVLHAPGRDLPPDAVDPEADFTPPSQLTTPSQPEAPDNPFGSETPSGDASPDTTPSSTPTGTPG